MKTGNFCVTCIAAHIIRNLYDRNIDNKLPLKTLETWINSHNVENLQLT